MTPIMAPDTFIVRWNSAVMSTLRPERLNNHVMMNDRAMRSTHHGQNGIVAIEIRPAGNRNMGPCHAAHKTPTRRVATAAG